MCKEELRKKFYSIPERCRASYYIERDDDRGMLHIFENLYKTVEIRCPYCDAVYHSELLQHALRCVGCKRKFAFFIDFEPKLEICALEKGGIGYPEAPDNEETAIGWEGECPDT